MDKFPIDILQYHIFTNLDFLSQIRFRQVCKWFYRLEIHDMRNIDKKYLYRITDEILNCYLNVKYLDISNNNNVTSVNKMTKLQILDAPGNCGVDDNGIKDINLVELHAPDNPKITNVNHMTKLQILDASSTSGIIDDGIKAINLSII